MVNQALFEANLRFIEREYPVAHARLAALGPLLAVPVIEDDAILDIDLGGGLLYKDDGRRLAKEQVDFFEVAPSRTGYNSVEGVTADSMVSRRFYDGMVKGLAELGVDGLTNLPPPETCYMFVFGIGLGYHLPLLAERFDLDHMIVCEAVDEFFFLSLRTIDWAALYQTLSERGCQLHLVVSPEPVALSAGISTVIDRVGEIFIDGAYLYRHYPFWPLDQAYHRLLDDIPVKMVGRGYYEDERKMVRNGAANLYKYDHYLLRGTFRRRYDVPAFIVAAGPSLDESIEYIRQWKDHAVIFSSGTTLQALIANDIIPDYHIELENTPHTYKLCKHIMEQRPDLFPDGRLTGIKMLGSVSVNPMVPELFDENYFFYRDMVTSTSCFGEGIQVMNGVGPSISNTSIAVAARLGFETMYLFGCDCGWRDAKNHHSKNTIYYTLDEFVVDSYEGQFSCPGNFGGTIHSNLIFTWTREMIEQKIDRFQLKLFNCSDGAFIKGSTPKLPESLDFTGAPVDKAEIFKRIRDASEFFKARDFLVNQDIDRFIPQVQRLRQDLVDLLDQCEAEGVDFRTFIARITDFDREGYLGFYKNVYPFFQGPIVGFTKAACYFLNRIGDESARAPAFKRFLTLYRELHLEMLQEGEDTFGEIKSMLETGEEPWWADGRSVVPGTTY